MEIPEDFKLSAAKIREEGGFEASLSPAPALFAGAFDPPQAVRSVSAELSFSVGSEELLLEGTLEAELDLECARCGKIFAFRVSENFDETFEDSLEYVDIKELLYEALVLSAPIKPLCSQDCKGACPACGKDKNSDGCGCKPAPESPFGKLQEIKKKLPKDRRI